MLRKRTRSVHKEQNQMGLNNNHNHNPQQNSDSGSESEFSFNNKNLKNNSSYYTTIPGLLVGLSPKGLALTDCDSVRSPTSPLDFRLFSGLGNPFRSSSSSSTKFSFSHENGQQRSWVGPHGGGESKLGLISIIDSLDDDGDGGEIMKSSGKVLRSSSSSSSSSTSSKNILFGPKLRVVNHNPFGSSSPKSLPKNYAISNRSSKTKSPLQKGTSDVLFEIGADDPSEEPDVFGKIRSCSLDSCRTISNLSGLRNNLNNNHNPNSSRTASSGPKMMSTIPGPMIGYSSSGNGFVIGSLSASEIELSEDYTCVISHGPNPKTTHIFGDCILETRSNNSSNCNKKEVELSHPNTFIATTNTANSNIFFQYPCDDFLSFCYSCNKKLEEDKDIYIYRGEKAFCSLNCRSLEILIDEELEKTSSDDKDSENPLSQHDHHADVDDNDDDDCKELFFETGIVASTP